MNDDQKWLEFEDFLRRRDVDDSTIEELKKEKIDPDVIMIMEENNLMKYFPQYGNRLAIIDYCKRRHLVRSKRKLSIVEKFKAKVMSLEGPDHVKRHFIDKCESSLTELDTTEETVFKTEAPKSNNTKPTRQIFFGWFMIQPNGIKMQVRERQGGGTKKPTVSKTAKKEELLKLGKKLFFPNGKSLHKGTLDQYNIDVCDYQMNSIDDNVSVGEMFSVTRLSHLRLYFTTSLKDPHSVNLGNEEENNKESSLDIKREYHFHQDYENMEKSDGEAETNLLENIDISIGNSLIVVVVNRGKVFEDLVNAFKILSINCNKISVNIVLPGGEIEKTDGSGFKNCLSEFWDTFFEKCTLGTCYKVPVIRHDFSQAEWQSISKILVKGWTSEKYFPIGLAPAFMQYCIFGDYSDLLESFSLFLCPSGREIINNCLNNYSKVDSDELIDLLQEYNCKKKPSSKNISKILKEIAHQEMLQKPAFIISSWRKYVHNMVTKEEFKEIYERLAPSSKNILKTLKTTCTSIDQDRVFNFLKKYIRESDESTLKALLRFCTGYDLLVADTIEITYNHTKGYNRAPVSQVCSCVLELPISYGSYLDFRLELNQLLASKVLFSSLIGRGCMEDCPLDVMGRYRDDFKFFKSLSAAFLACKKT